MDNSAHADSNNSIVDVLLDADMALNKITGCPFYAKQIDAWGRVTQLLLIQLAILHSSLCFEASYGMNTSLPSEERW